MMSTHKPEVPAMQSVGDLVAGGLARLVLQTRAAKCPTHGDYIDRLRRAVGDQPQAWMGCAQCAHALGEQKLKQQAAQELAEAAQATAMARAKATAERFATSGVPRRFMAATWDNYRTTDTAPTGVGTQAYALARCRAYADNFAAHLAQGRALFLLGNMGTGKNHLATCIARQVSDAGHSVVFTTAAQMVMAHQDVVVHKVPAGKGVTSLLRDFAGPDLLILDEMFRQSDSPAALRFLFDVLNARYADCLPTVIISNKTIDEVKALLDPVLVDRLEERRAIMVPFNWQSVRASVGNAAAAAGAGAGQTRVETAK